MRGVLLCLAVGLWGQEGEVRETLRAYRAAERAGDGPAFFARGYRFFGPYGHMFERAMAGDRTLPRGKRRSDFVFSVHFVKADVAVAAGVWRDDGARPPFDAGLANVTLVREEGRWKIANSRDGYLPSPDSLYAAGAGRALGAEWEPLFDGKTGAGWMSVSGVPGLPATWRVEDGCLVTVGGGPQMSLRTVRQFTTFELAWEWKAAAGANSGVKYRLYAVRVSEDGAVGDGVGYEYQLADDEGDAGALEDGRQRSGALYGIKAPPPGAARRVGEWNESRIVMTPSAVEHWLNGVMTAREEVDMVFASPISLQHHTREMRFRNIRIRRVP